MSPSPSHDHAAARWQRAAVALVAALVLLELLWETVLAPARPGGSWLAVKALPLAAVGTGLMSGNIKARQWASLLLPFYFGEALVRAITESGRHATVAAVVAALAIAAFVAVLQSFRASRAGG